MVVDSTFLIGCCIVICRLLQLTQMNLLPKSFMKRESNDVDAPFL